MKIFVTVGHTRFDSLFSCIDSISRSDWHFVCQIFDGTVRPAQAECFEFACDIFAHYKAADVVITHAGAGTVYSLLEMEKPTIVVANTDRVDPHQEDLLNYVESNQYAQVCRDLDQLEALIDTSFTFQPAKYKTETFAAVADIAARLGIG